MAHTDSEVLLGDLCSQLAALERGELRSVDLVERQLAAIQASQPGINAFLALDAQGARAAAQASDARREQGCAGLLDGVVIAVKDNIDVAGMVTSAGMATRSQHAPANVDNPAVARLRAAGAVLVGKLNMHEAALGADNNNPHYGACHNPHRPGFTPGGSSGGSGAAVAAGLCAAALGSDSMGSVRIPASYCGVFGLKPSWGAISARGTVPVSRRLDHIGPLARSARDLGLLLQVMADFDPECAQSRAVEFAAPWQGPLRIGVIDFGDTVQIEPAVQAAFRQGLAALTELGHEEVSLPAPSLSPSRARRAGLLVCEAEMLVEHEHAWRESRELFSPGLARMLGWAETRPLTDLVAAELLLDQAQVQVQQWLAQCDVLALPTTPQQAFAFGSPVPASQADLTANANIAGCPALSLPLPVAADELPIGMQLVGRIGDDLRLVVLAEALQAALAIQPQLPPACLSWWPR